MYRLFTVIIRDCRKDSRDPRRCTVPAVYRQLACYCRLCKGERKLRRLSRFLLYFSLAAFVLTDIILLLRAAGVFKKPYALSWLSLALGIASVIFTVVYFAISGVAKSLAVAIIAAQALLPEYMASIYL